jgi:hypothetical protein
MRRHLSSTVIGFALAALLTPYVATFADALTHEHNYCAAHEDFVHEGDAASESATLALKQSPAPVKAGDKAHSHCETWKSGLRPMDTFERCPIERPIKAMQRSIVEPEAVEIPQLPVYALAPKTSPPNV